MRHTFTKTLLALAEADPRIVLLTGDLGYSVLEPFAEAFPDRFFNMGVAEQNMIGVATGLAEAGLLPFAYSIATFATLRGYEMIRNGPVRHTLPVRIVGAGGGFEYGAAGPSHHATEDIGAMRLLGGIDIVVPADAAQTATALRATHALPRPVYYRIGKDETYAVPGLDARYEHGRATIIRDGDAVLLLTLGPLVREVLEAAECLAAEGIEARVMLVPSPVPFPAGDVRDALRHHTHLMTIEDHVAPGGLGECVASLLAASGSEARFRAACVRPGKPERVGGRAYCLRENRLDPDGLAAAIRSFLGDDS